MKVAIIGGGKLGSAFARCLLAKEVVSIESLFVIQRGKERIAKLQTELQCKVLEGADSVIGNSEVVIIAVRPQDFLAAAAQFKRSITQKQLLLSVMAGIPIRVLSGNFGGHTQIVRSMPNLPVQIGKGISPYVTHADVTDSNRSRANKVFEAVGASLKFEHEKQLDAATAVSGSGPGYVFTFIESMLNGASELGFSPEHARALVAQTLKGAVDMWLEGPISLNDLREGMRLKGGTTEAAYKVLEGEGWDKVLVQAMRKAGERACELGQDVA